VTYNVLHFLDSFDQGGTERQALQLVRLLKEHGRYRVHLACMNSRGTLRQEALNISGGEITEYPLSSFYDRNTITQLYRLVRNLRKQQIHIVHCHDFYTNIFGLTAAMLARVPVRIASRRQSAFPSAKQRFVSRLSYRMAKAIVANCKEVGRQLNQEGVPAKKIVTVYNGLDTERIRPPLGLTRDEMLKVLNLPRDIEYRFVTIVANLRLVLKDHPMFLRAARRVQAVIPDAAFLIAGEGELIDSIRALALELGLSKNTFFLGRCDRVAELLAISDVCVLTSTREGFSNSILEYMAAGRPVVATDVGGVREAVEDSETGYIVKPHDDEALASHIIALLQDPPGAAAMGRRGREVVETKFSCAAQLKLTEGLYRQLLGNDRSYAFSTDPARRTEDQ
jgi:glycosyltransferase involved in cell wall biosynthesis